MDVQAVIKQIQKLPPEDRRRVEAALRASSSDSHSSQPSSEVEKPAMVEKEGLWVITAKSEGELTDDIGGFCTTPKISHPGRLADGSKRHRSEVQ